MDDPERLAEEWERKRAIPAIETTLRPYLDLWPAADLRPAGGRRRFRPRAGAGRASPAISAGQPTPSGVVRLRRTTRRSVHPGHDRRRRRRRNARGLGAARLRARSDAAIPALFVLGPFMEIEPADRLHGARRPAGQGRGDHLRRQYRGHVRRRCRRRRDGRLQYVLRGVVVRQAGPDRAADEPAAEQYIRASARRSWDWSECCCPMTPRIQPAWPTQSGSCRSRQKPSTVRIPDLLDGLPPSINWSTSRCPRSARFNARAACPPALDRLSAGARPVRIAFYAPLKSPDHPVAVGRPNNGPGPPGGSQARRPRCPDCIAVPQLRRG